MPVLKANGPHLMERLKLSQRVAPFVGSASESQYPPGVILVMLYEAKWNERLCRVARPVTSVLRVSFERSICVCRSANATSGSR